jgi:hypothetical protein
MGHPWFPIDHKVVICAEASDVLRGLAEFVETYLAEGIMLM